ncbi:MAG: 16S rRNA (guanine(966)-N(2))-methyltransferase RsmD [Lachnospiraceae bacterium]
MRVIAGKAKHLQLKTVKGMDTRPTTDRIKETLFNMLQMDVPGSIFIDLFSGSGAIGIEALSRGARKAYFVENSRQAVACIRENLEHTKMADQAHVLMMDAVSSIRMIEQEKETADIVFMDPPYGKGMEKEVLYRLADSSLLGEHTVIIVESDLDTSFDYVENLQLEILKQKRYKTNMHTFLITK